MDEPRTLVEICEKEDLHVELNGNIYCSVGMNKKIDCPRQAKERDHNGLYPCMDLRWDVYQIE